MVHLFITPLNHPLFARGGGGGSGGGGGGSGGGSGGGGGGGLGFLALIGYVPSHFVTAFTIARLPKVTAIVLGAVTGLTVTSICMFINIGFGIIVLIGAVVGVYSGAHNWLGVLTKSSKKAQQIVAVAASKDPAWEAQGITDRVRAAFNMYQEDWTKLNTARLRSYMTANYSQHAYYMMLALFQMDRRNNMVSWTISNITITEAVDAPLDGSDRFTASITAQADDQLQDVASQKLLNRDQSQFQEFWTFVRSGNDWLLDRIDQATADMSMSRGGMQQFAEEHRMYYSLDWGTLLLPSHGQIFKRGSFVNSDINNHIIGDWEGLLVQLYTYIPSKRSQSREYLIGQINLPKSYGGILIQRHTNWSWLSRMPRNYKKVTFEWPDFNKRYQVSATDVEKVTAFELLNPKTMADLYDADLPINIEVVDNIVYFYCAASTSIKSYDSMLKVLQMAYKELKR